MVLRLLQRRIASHYKNFRAECTVGSVLLQTTGRVAADRSSHALDLKAIFVHRLVYARGPKD